MWQIIGNVAAVLGLIGVSINSIAGKAYESHIAVAAIGVTCITCLFYLFVRVRRWEGNVYPKGYKSIATFVRYSTTDGKTIIHETFRQIQIKHSYLTEIEHKYKWTGSKEPVISSHLQTLGPVSMDVATGSSVRKVKFERARFCNDTEVVHLRSTLDDADEKSETFVSLRLSMPITIVQFRVELLHCSKPQHANMVAVVERKSCTVIRDDYERVATVPFDLTSRSFEYLLKHPEANFDYRLRWDRPALLQQRSRGKRKTKEQTAEVVSQVT